MNLDKKQIIFIIVFMLLIISIIYRVLNPFVQPRVDKLTFTGNKNNKISKPDDTIKARRQNKPQALVLKFLNKSDISGKVYKDLFSIYRPPQKEKIKVPVKKDIQPEKIIEIVKKDPVLEAREYIASYALYGTYKSKDKKAVFLSKNKLVLVARIGDRLDGKYLIEDIQDNYIKIKALDLNETIHLDMREFNND
jgi:hypothetical protein